jgi:hypothetical protein
MLGGIDMWMNQLFGWSPFGTLKHGKPDYATLKPIGMVKKIVYPKPDGVLTFDKLSSVFLSATNHEEDQPVHLKLTDPNVPVLQNLPIYGEPARLYCPAGVYEVVYADPGEAVSAALRDQRAELRPLQDLRHQGPPPRTSPGPCQKGPAVRTTRTCDRAGGRFCFGPEMKKAARLGPRGLFHCLP